METGDSAKRYVIDTASGVRLVLDNPRPEDILIEDVAGGLSKVCRFGAQPLEYYSVAQHALLVRRLVVESGYPELALAALHHDSHEAYLCDIPSPLKSKIFTATQISTMTSAGDSTVRSPRRSTSSTQRKVRRRRPGVRGRGACGAAARDRAIRGERRLRQRRYPSALSLTPTARRACGS